MVATGAVAGTAAAIFQMLPTLLAVTNIIVYIVAILFFGSIAAKGWRGYMAWPKKLGLRVLLGAVCVITGVAITPLLRLDNPMIKLLQLDMIAGMLIATIVLFAALKLMTLNVPYSMVLKERIAHLQSRLEKRKDKEAEMPKNRLKSPTTIAGIVVFIAFIVFAMMNFHGLPDTKTNLLQSMGLSEADFAKITDAMNAFQNSPLGNMSAGCLASLQEMQGKPSLYENPPAYANDVLKAEIASKAGQNVAGLYKIDSNGRSLVIALLENGKQCYATTTEFCMCA
jgi:hypothetical protein